MSQGITISSIPQGVSVTISGSSSYRNANYTFYSNLTSGVNSQFISYNIPLSNLPSGVNCQFENPVDNYSYVYSVSQISISGFQISFSDFLKSTGYLLSTELSL